MLTAEPSTFRVVKLMTDEAPMPACPRESMVGPYHDGELPAAARDEFEQHLSTCPACSAELRRVRTVSRWLQPLTVPSLTPAERTHLADEALRDAARRDEVDSRKLTLRPAGSVRWVRWLTAAAAAVFLFSVVQLFLANHGKNSNGTTGGPGGVPTVYPSTAPGDGRERVDPERDQDQPPAGKPGAAQPKVREGLQQQ